MFLVGLLTAGSWENVRDLARFTGIALVVFLKLLFSSWRINGFDCSEVVFWGEFISIKSQVEEFLGMLRIREALARIIPALLGA